jgi:hypothetical protein
MREEIVLAVKNKRKQVKYSQIHTIEEKEYGFRRNFE